MRRLPLLLVLLACSCARESPREAPREPDLPRPLPVKAADPNLTPYGPAVAAYLADVRTLPKLVRERSGLRAYTRALDSSEELFSRIPYAPPGLGDVERALKALRKATTKCRETFELYERSVATELGMKRLLRQGNNARDVESLARERTATFELLQQAGETIRDRIERVEALLRPARSGS